MNPITETKDILDIKAVAELLGTTPNAIYKLKHEGKIPCHKPYGKLIFLKSEIMEWIKKN